MYQKLMLIFLSCLVSMAALAECSDVYCDDVSVLKMQVNSYDSVVWVQTTGTESNLNCTPNSGVYLWLDTSTVGGKNVYSALLAYKMSGQNMGVRLEENSNPCKILYVEAQ